MKSSSEYRAAALRQMREGRWVTKFLFVWMVMLGLFRVVQYAWDAAVVSMGIQTWSMFLQSKAQAMASGLDLTVPSRAMALGMTEASAFETFMTCILSGILSFGVTGLFLRAAKASGRGASGPDGSDAPWFPVAFGGFKYPLGVAWLYFRQVLQIVLWSALFVLPGIMAYYRYCQCWNLKVEHPDWSAGRCLSESARLMDGYKARRFALDLSYWRPLLLLVLGLLVTSTFAATPMFGAAGGVLAFALTIASLWWAVFVTVYLSVGQALFYLDLQDSARRGAD